MVCAYATSGEQGFRDDPALAAGLSQRRERELAAASALLGVSEQRFFGHPDGALDDVPFADGVAYVGALLDELEPATVVTFGPDGFTGHPDHITVHHWVIAVTPRHARH